MTVKKRIMLQKVYKNKFRQMLCLISFINEFPLFTLTTLLTITIINYFLY